MNQFQIDLCSAYIKTYFLFLGLTGVAEKIYYRHMGWEAYIYCVLIPLILLGGINNLKRMLFDLVAFIVCMAIGVFFHWDGIKEIPAVILFQGFCIIYALIFISTLAGEGVSVRIASLPSFPEDAGTYEKLKYGAYHLLSAIIGVIVYGLAFS